MKYLKLIICVLLASSLNGEELKLNTTIPFDIATQSYELVENNAIEILKKEAIEEYIGCSVDVSQYDVKVKIIKIGERALTTDTYSIEVTIDVSSKELDDKSYYRGLLGAICRDIDISIEKEGKSWDSFEVGLYTGLSGTQEVIEMTSSNTKINFEYDSALMVGLMASYSYKILDSQYIGAKVFIANGFESYTDGDPTADVTSDGTPSILRFGAGAFYGYRYHLKTDFSIAANFLSDSLTRTYINNTYSATATRVNVEAGAGYLILPSLKIWGTIASDTSMNLGVSWVY